MNLDNTIVKLNKLIITNNNRIEVYETASNQTEEADLKKLFGRFIQTSTLCKCELAKEVITLGGIPEEGTIASGKFLKVWKDIKAALKAGNYKKIFSTCEFCEDVSVESYYNIIMNDRTDLRSKQVDMLNRQYLLIKAEHDKIKELGEALIK